MQVTSREVTTYIYKLVKNSYLAQKVSGRVYHAGMRPKSFREDDYLYEDIVVSFTAGVGGDIQEGVVTILVFVPSIVDPDSGRHLENMRRTAELEHIVQRWVDSLTDGHYLLRLKDTIATYYDSEIRQHFISIRLYYKHY